jgi:hypothetical protein
VAAVELSNRFENPDGTGEAKDYDLPRPPFTTPGQSADSSSVSNRIFVIMVAALVVAGAAVFARYVHGRIRQAQRTRIREFIQDKNAESPGLREKTGGRRNGYTDIPENSELELT